MFINKLHLFDICEWNSKWLTTCFKVLIFERLAKSIPILFCCHLKLNNVVTFDDDSLQFILCCMQFFTK